MARKKKRRAYGELHLSQEDGVFYIRGTVDGRRIRKSTRTRDPRIADRILIEYRAEVSDRLALGERAVTTFGEVVDRYEREFPGVVSHFYLPRIRALLGGLRCGEIDQLVMTQTEDALFPKVSVKTKRRHLYSPVAAILRYGKGKGLCDLPRFEVPSVSKKSEKPVEHAPDGWIKDFLAVNECPRLRALVLLVTTTGLRAGEACQLTADTIDWVRGEFVVLDKRGEFVKVVIPEAAREAMYALKQARGRLFGFRNNGGINQAVERTCIRHGLKVYTTKQFGRHAFATRLLLAGVSSAKVAVAGRWSGTEMVDLVYGHVTVEDVMDEVNKVGDRFK